MSLSTNFTSEKKIADNQFNLHFCQVQRFHNFDDLNIRYIYYHYSEDNLQITLFLRSEYTYYPFYLFIGSKKFTLRAIDEDGLAIYLFSKI